MTRASVHVVSCAMALIAVAAKLAHAQAPPRAPTVPLLVVAAPPTFDLERFRSALETYVANAQLVLVPRVTADAMAICAAAAAAARDAHSPIALWVRWTAGEMVIERVGEAGCDAIESSTVEIAADQPAFVYRVAALKVASLVRELPAPPPPPPPPPPPAPVAPAVAVQAPADRRVVAIELGASAVAGTDAAERLYFVAVGAWFGRAWSVGGSLRLSAAHEAAAAGGSGHARVFGAFVGVRRELVARRAWAVDATLELGVLGVRASAARIETGAQTREQVWVPTAALAPRLRIPLIASLAITLGPTLELSTQEVELTVGDSRLYRAAAVRVRGDVQAAFTF